MTAIDIAVIVVTAASVIWSAWRGLIRELFSIIAVLGAVLAGWRLGPEAAGWLGGWIADPLHARVAGFAGVFICAGLGLGIAGRLASRAVKATPLRWLDMAAGAVFGLVKAAALLSVTLLVLVVAWPQAVIPAAEESYLTPRLVKGAVRAGGMVDEFVAEHGGERLDLARRYSGVVDAIRDADGDLADSVDGIERAIRHEPPEPEPDAPDEPGLEAGAQAAQAAQDVTPDSSADADM